MGDRIQSLLPKLYGRCSRIRVLILGQANGGAEHGDIPRAGCDRREAWENLSLQFYTDSAPLALSTRLMTPCEKIEH